MKHSGAEAAAAVFEPVGGDRQSLKRDIVHHLVHDVGKDPIFATTRDWLTATSLAVRDRLIERRLFTKQHYAQLDVKRVYYLSMEFLLGRMLGTALCNMGMYDECVEALRELDVDLEDIEDVEPDAALGNGGLGRLAACILDSMATLCLPGHGYGIRYEFGMFRQAIEGGQQIEHPDNWLRYGNTWEFPRPEKIYPVHFYGHVSTHTTARGEARSYWHAGEEVIAMAYDFPVPGYGGHKNVNNLRLWSAKATRDFDLGYFNEGDYMGALVDKNQSETISKVLYPNDATAMGRELRFKQEYFFVSASLQDIIHRHCIRQGHPIEDLPNKVAIQLNDTHPAIAVAELMRLLIDVRSVPWNKAWNITKATFSYTNHTLMPEALETWPVELVERVLPRHLEIIYRINHEFLNTVRHRYPGDVDLVRRLSIIDEDHGRRIRMAHLAVVGSHKVNGVAELHTELLKRRLFKDFYTLWPEKLVNVTNGITPRLWLYQANPGLRRLISEHIGTGWIMDLRELRKIEPLAEDPEFRARFAEVKRENKIRLSEFVARTTGVQLDPDALFDVQVKRMHEYKRQILNLLHVVTLYDRLRSGEGANRVPRAVIISGKAAPSYVIAKQLIRLINDVADVINNDPVVGNRLKLVFIPNYEVSVAMKIIPAADLSEQISTAGTEASGTGNMKLALNGALTIGTMDGANIEIHDEVGSDNIFIFGLRTDEVSDLRSTGYRPRDCYEKQPELKKILDMIGSGFFSPEEPDRYQSIVDHLLDDDPYLVLGDYASYIHAQELVDELYLDRDTWIRKSILNTARVDKFCIDRTVWEYAQDIWEISPQCYVEESLPLTGAGVEVD